jgi:hypothetical protein
LKGEISMVLRVISGGKRSSSVSRHSAAGKQSKLIKIGLEDKMDYRFNLLEKWRALLEELQGLNPIHDQTKISLIKRQIRIIKTKLNSVK